MLPKIVSRRKAALLLGAGGAPLLETPQAVAAPQQQPQQQPPQDDLSIQRQNVARWRQRLRAVKLPIEVEPAFSFKP